MTHLQTLQGYNHIFRHPFERLVSCYKDKFETGSRNDYIFKTFNPSIIESKTERPTFVEFVDYLIRTPIEKYNDHWLPNWIQCQVCTQNYDIIGKNIGISKVRVVEFHTLKYRIIVQDGINVQGGMCPR